MAVLTIRDVSRRSGLSEPTLRYYEEIGLIGPIARDESSGHRRYQTEDLDVLQALACMRATGVGIEDMRTYQANRGRGHEAAAEQRSKAIAERAAWDLMQHEGGGTELVVVNPTFILGPTLTTELGSSLQLVKAMLDGTMTVVRRQRFGVSDVRDVADLHIRAMAAPGAAGKRFLALADGPTISFLELAETLRRRLGPLASRVSVQEAPGEDPPRLVIHNDRAREELGWRPRPVETTIVESAQCLRDLGLLVT